MTPTYNLAEQANYLRDDIRDIMPQIQHAKNENNTAQYQLLYLLLKKYSIVAEASKIITEANQALNTASGNHLSQAQHLDLQNACTIAREVVQLAHTNSVCIIQSHPNHVKGDHYDSYYLFEITDVVVNFP